MLINFNAIDKAQEQSNSQVIISLGNSSFPVSRKLLELTSLIQTNSTAHWVSDGEWSMHELLIALLKECRHAIVYISSYAFSETPARTIADLKDQDVIIDLFCIVDNRIDVRSASALTLIQNCANACKLVRTHAKVTVLQGMNKSFVVMGSANYTENKRYEAGIVSTDPEVINFHKQWILKAIDDSNKAS